MRYVAIDFETASGAMDSACAVGLVRMDEEGCILDEYSSLIRPRNAAFDSRCFSVHHLDPISVLSAPSAADVWPVMREFIGDLPLVAHNAEFDISVLRSTLASWGIEPCHNRYYCTLSLARKVWKGRHGYSLSAIASDLGWEYRAHDALEDSRICGRLFSRLCGTALFDDDVAERFFQRIYRKGEYPRIV